MELSNINWLLNLSNLNQDFILVIIFVIHKSGNFLITDKQEALNQNF